MRTRSNQSAALYPVEPPGQAGLLGGRVKIVGVHRTRPAVDAPRRPTTMPSPVRGPRPEPGMREINLDLVRVTEAAAIAASAWVGSGNKEPADRDATAAMRDRLNALDFAPVVRIGEGKKDKSFGLFAGERVGRHPGEPAYDLAFDPIDGT